MIPHQDPTDNRPGSKLQSKRAREDGHGAAVARMSCCSIEKAKIFSSSPATPSWSPCQFFLPSFEDTPALPRCSAALPTQQIVYQYLGFLSWSFRGSGPRIVEPLVKHKHQRRCCSICRTLRNNPSSLLLLLQSLRTRRLSVLPLLQHLSRSRSLHRMCTPKRSATPARTIWIPCLMST
ncbi:hypothetical protein BR93DRAFT_388893 [Coniochaeta sp. PMI_546]|nr:hypothetical protein BR93DRAFT_388893 [Coniochaeta sp. PMI_546]